MSLALRYGTSASFFFATLLLGAAMFFPVENIEWRAVGEQDSRDAGMWTLEAGLPKADRVNVTTGETWYDGEYSDTDGILRLRIAAPMILVGTLVLLACGFMVLSQKGVQTGWTGTAALLVAGIGMLLLLLGINAFAKSVTPINYVTDAGISPRVGFWMMFLGLLIGSGAALASFSVRPEAVGRIGPDGQPLPPLPILSVENPEAFNPMANRDPRPFRQEEFPYKSFEQTGGRRTFRSGKEGEEEAEEQDATAAAGDKPQSQGGQASPAQKGPPKPAAPGAAKPAASAPKPPASGNPAAAKPASTGTSAPAPSKPPAKPKA